MFKSALESVIAAGAELVEFDIGLLLAEQKLNAPDEFTYIHEMPRELSRHWLPQSPLLHMHVSDMTCSRQTWPSENITCVCDKCPESCLNLVRKGTH